MSEREEQRPEKMKRKAYERELARLETELVKLQGWVKHEGLKVVVVFEGRDSAGKGGIIKRITRRLNPRVVSIRALGTPTDRQKTQWYFQRYITELPAAGEVVLFDRSWYNRAGVERVMGFCTDAQYWQFLRDVPSVELGMIESGITLIKYWLHIDEETQEERFQQRLDDRRRRWKLSPMDLEARARWVDYSRARDIMLEHTDTEHAPWHLVDANVKRHARLNVMSHLLEQIPYEDLTPAALELPERQPAGDYVPPPASRFTWVPERYP